MKKNNYISAMDKTALNDSQKNKLKDLYNAVNNPVEDKIMNVNEKKKTRRKPFAVVAASLALLIGIGSFALALPKGDNSFMLTVNAAELKEGKAVLADASACGFSVSEDDNNHDRYSIDFPVKYEGDNIDSVTYSISKGRFELFKSEENDSPVSLETNGNLYFSISGESEKITNSDYAQEHASYQKTKEFTVSYDDQKDSNRNIYITGDSKHLTKQESKEVKKAIYGDVSLEGEKAAFDKLLGNLIITSTVKFKDGTTETQNIKVGTKVIDYSEATMDEAPPEKDKPGKYLFFTFELV